MHPLSDFDRLKGHPLRQRERIGEIKHACPECPTPGAVTPGGVTLVANPGCQFCHGSGVVSEEMLARWQEWILRQPAG